jgi:nucleoside-diphosphate-sugar epimerase
MTVLVTGANGLVGKALLRRIKNSTDLNGVYTDINPNKELNIKRMDVTNLSQVESYVDILGDLGLNTIYHLAALCGGKESEKRPWDYLNVNVRGTMNILEAMRRQDIPKLIFTSSWSVYGNHDGLITDSTPTSPLNSYGVSKSVCEKEIKLYCTLYGINATVLRPTMIYGPEQTEMNHVQQILDSMESGYEFEIWGSGEHTRELLYVDDMAKILTDCYWYNPHRFERFVIGTENPLSVKQVAETGQRISNGFDIKYVPSTKWVFNQRSICHKMKDTLEIDPTDFTDIKTGLWKCLEYRISKE